MEAEATEAEAMEADAAGIKAVDAETTMNSTITEVVTMIRTVTMTVTITIETIGIKEIMVRKATTKTEVTTITETTNPITTRVLPDLDGITMQTSPITDHDNQMPLSRI